MPTQPAPTVTAADVERIVGRDYAPEQRARVPAMLHEYGTADWHREVARVRLAVLKLADGSPTALRSHVEVAKVDYRDVLAAAEYPRYMKRDVEALSEGERADIIAEDWAQYQAWLNG